MLDGVTVFVVQMATVLFYDELTEKYVSGACLGIQGYGCVNQHSYWIHARALCVWPRGLLDNHKKDQQNKECLAQLAQGKRKRSHCTLQLQSLKLMMCGYCNLTVREL